MVCGGTGGDICGAGSGGMVAGLNGGGDISGDVLFIVCVFAREIGGWGRLDFMPCDCFNTFKLVAGDFRIIPFKCVSKCSGDTRDAETEEKANTFWAVFNYSDGNHLVF